MQFCLTWLATFQKIAFSNVPASEIDSAGRVCSRAQADAVMEKHSQDECAPISNWGA